MTRINRHEIYLHCLTLAKEILRRGNFEGQQIYIHVGAQQYWETELLRPYKPQREPRGAVANIGLKHDGVVRQTCTPVKSTPSRSSCGTEIEPLYESGCAFLLISLSAF